MSYSVDYWYRHESDDDRSVRTHAQMMSRADSSADIAREVQNLQRGGYEVQRIQVHTVCPRCDSNGRYVVKVYKRSPAEYADCSVCHGTGHIGALDYPVPVYSVDTNERVTE